MMRGRAGLLALAAAAGLCVAPAPALAEIRIGLAAPLTGRMAGVGLAMQRALEAAIADANAEGGVQGQTLSLHVEDDGCASATAEGAARRLTAEKTVLVIGHPCSSAAAATASLYGRTGVLLIAVGPRHPDVTRTKPPVAAPALRLAGRDDRQGDAAAAWLLSHAPQRRVAIVHDRTGYARAIVERTIAALRAAAVEPVALLPIVANKHDYGDAILRLRDSRAEAVLFAGYPEEASLIVYGIEKAKLTLPTLGTDALATPGFADFASKAGNPVHVLLPMEPEVQGEDDIADEKSFGARTRGALEAWLVAARRIGTTEGNALASALRGPSVETRSLGLVQFDENGDLVGPSFTAASARAGRWVRGE